MTVFRKDINKTPYDVDREGPGIPPLKDKSRKPWSGLSVMMSETMGTVTNRNAFGRVIKKET